MQLLERLKVKATSNREAAKMIGLSESRFGRALKGQGGSLSIPKCAALAMALEESPAVVLRAAGKGEVADLLERFYGPPRTVSLAPRLADDEQWCLDLWRQIPTKDRETVRAVVARFARLPKARMGRPQNADPQSKRA